MSAQAPAQARDRRGRRGGASAPGAGSPGAAAVGLEHAQARIGGRVVWSDVSI